MKIVHVSTADIRGGAALSAYRLHRGLLLTGQASSMLVRDKTSRDNTVVAFEPPMDLMSRFKRKSRRTRIAQDWNPYRATKPAGYELFSDDRSPFGDTLWAQLKSCDVVHLHWVASFLDYEPFFRTVPKQKPIVWTLHDMNAFTGGCHYDMGCGRYASRCGACPQLGSNDESDLAAAIWMRKVGALGQVPTDRLCVVTPSRWLGQTVRRSPILSRFRLEVIPYGIDLEAFAPRDRTAARDVLGIPQSAKVVLFLAEIVTNRRKGFQVLSDALVECVKELENIWLFSVGQHKPFLHEHLRGSHLNYVGEDRFLSLAYSAADVFVIPSLQDNLPNTVLEAMACGVPVVGFEVGGIPDMVRDGQTGRLVKPGDISGLKRAIIEMLGDQESLMLMSRSCRQIAQKEYALARQAQDYYALYQTLV